MGKDLECSVVVVNWFRPVLICVKCVIARHLEPRPERETFVVFDVDDVANSVTDQHDWLQGWVPVPFHE
jgi:hypothetical protein